MLSTLIFTVISGLAIFGLIFYLFSAFRTDLQNILIRKLESNELIDKLIIKVIRKLEIKGVTKRPAINVSHEDRKISDVVNLARNKKDMLRYSKEVNLCYPLGVLSSRWQLGFSETDIHNDAVIPTIVLLETTNETAIEVQVTATLRTTRSSENQVKGETIDKMVLPTVPMKFGSLSFGTGTNSYYSGDYIHWSEEGGRYNNIIVDIQMVVTYRYLQSQLSSDNPNLEAFSKAAMSWVFRRLQILHIEDTFKDITLVCKDNKEIRAHKLILSANCTVFDTMFRNEMQESLPGVVNIPDIDFKVMEILIKLWYTGELEKNWRDLDVIENLVYAAHKYRIQELLKLLDDTLGNEKIFESNIRILQLAQQFELHNAANCIAASLKTKTMLANSPSEILCLYGSEFLSCSQPVNKN